MGQPVQKPLYSPFMTFWNDLLTSFTTHPFKFIFAGEYNTNIQNAFQTYKSLTSLKA